MSELAQFGHRLLGVLERLGQVGEGIVFLVLEGATCQLQSDHRVNKPLLRSVVQVANNAPALLVGRHRAIRARDAANADRASTFEIALATSSANSSIRFSVPAGNGTW